MSDKSWNIWGKLIQVGDRLKISQLKQMPFSQMKEDDNGTFVYLPKAEDEIYKDKEKAKKILQQIETLIEELQDSWKH